MFFCRYYPFESITKEVARINDYILIMLIIVILEGPFKLSILAPKIFRAGLYIHVVQEKQLAKFVSLFHDNEYLI